MLQLSQTQIQKYFNIAKELAARSTQRKTKVGCVIVYRNRIIGSGINSNKTNPMQRKYNRLRGFDPDSTNTKNTIHAECDAILHLCDYNNINWNKVHIFIYRIKNKTGFGLARPCKSCEAMIRDLGIKNIYYTTENGWAYERYE